MKRITWLSPADAPDWFPDPESALDEPPGLLAAGGDLASPLQRLWRDANAAALHLSLDWEAIAAMYGQRKLGLEPVGIF